MAQSQIISVLLRAHQLTGGIKYREICDRALGAFRLSTLEGGVTWTDDEGFKFYEEYPSDPPCHVLNGHIWSMFGLYDYYRATNLEEALGLFNAGIDSLKKYLHRYDTGYWTTYDQLRKPGYAKIRYQRYHIELSKVLHAITGEPVLHEYIVRWTGYLNRLRRLVFPCASFEPGWEKSFRTGAPMAGRPGWTANDTGREVLAGLGKYFR